MSTFERLRLFTRNVASLFLTFCVFFWLHILPGIEYSLITGSGLSFGQSRVLLFARFSMPFLFIK